MLAWLGSILLAVCGFPELIRTVQDNECHIGWGMLLTWFFGEVLVFIHVYRKHRDRALLTNYAFNILILIVLLFYKIKGTLDV